MSKPTIAEAGWLDFTLDHLRQSLKAAEGTASDIARLRMCDAAGCGRLFDSGDSRSKVVMDGRIEYNFCPACNMEAMERPATDAEGSGF